jgi:TnpA family transposase
MVGKIPRRRTASIGMYTHVRDRWGIFYDQPILLNERQAGAAIEGVIRQSGSEDVAQLAVDTHGYTDFAMSLSRLLGFDLARGLLTCATAACMCPGIMTSRPNWLRWRTPMSGWP